VSLFAVMPNVVNALTIAGLTAVYAHTQSPAVLLAIVFVHVERYQVFEPRLVRTGLHNDVFTEILSGVNPGEQVVTTGSHVLKTELFKDRLGKDD